jgi:Mn2+/Fe2+ NRAMP family transporter
MAAPVSDTSVRAIVLAMIVILGVVMVAQGSLAIQTYNTLKDCTKGIQSAKKHNHVQIAFLTFGVIVLGVGLGFGGKLVHDSMTQ